MPNITEFHNLKEELPNHVQLVAVSKTKPIDDVLAIYNEGQRIFGENRVAELVEKSQELPQDIQWHFIGNLQSKKVKQLAAQVTLIHSVDSFKLLKEINKQAAKIDKQIGVLLQFHIATENSKSGFNRNEFKFDELINLNDELSFVKIEGVMGMATFTDDQKLVESEFNNLKSIYNELKTECFKDDEHFKTISMGMSGDYKLAIECGSNMVRIGSTIFGSR